MNGDDAIDQKVQPVPTWWWLPGWDRWFNFLYLIEPSSPDILLSMPLKMSSTTLVHEKAWTKQELRI